MTTFNHSQRQVLETYWTVERSDWLEAECTLAAGAGDKPLTNVGKDRREAKRRAANVAKAIEKAINEIEALHTNAGEASDVVAGFPGGVLPLLIKARNAAWQLENTLEQLTATKAEERNSILIKRIAKKLMDDGVDVNDRQDGALHQVCGLALAAVGTEPKDLRGTIRQVIRRL